MMKKLELLFEKYNFDYIFIHPNDIDNIQWELNPEEIFMDFVDAPGCIGTLKLKNKIIAVYWDKKITPGEVIFKYDTIQKERKVKLNNLIYFS